jgi:uncharacterized protein YbjT (DUF2867 family)
LGATRAQAGSFAEQRKIDYDLSLNLAKAARAAGVETYVLVSSTGASSGSMFQYTKMKGELEDEVQKIGFKNTVILRPGFIVGERAAGHLDAENALRQLSVVFRRFAPGLKDSWAQDADVIAKAAVSAGIQCMEGKREAGAWILGQSDIVRLGRKEWVESEPPST